MLYDLVILRKTLLENYSTEEIESTIARLQDKLESIKLQVPVIGDGNLEFINNLISHYTDVIAKVREPHETFKKQIQQINDEISRVSHELFTNNYDLEEHDGGFDHIRNHRRIYLRPEVEELVRQRIQLYTSWQYPSLEVGCRDGEWTQHLVAADPLYVMDKYQEFLDSTNGKFPESYQRRLRKYRLNNYDFSVLPQKQFGFIFSWGHFNYVSLDTITQTLKKIKELLRPGGVFLFSYNDGDTPAGAGMAENFSQTFIPQSILIPTCMSLGFEVVQSFNELPNISWIEVKNPGSLTTIKAHQVMGEIKRRIP